MSNRIFYIKIVVLVVVGLMSRGIIASDALPEVKTIHINNVDYRLDETITIPKFLGNAFDDHRVAISLSALISGETLHFIPIYRYINTTYFVPVVLDNIAFDECSQADSSKLTRVPLWELIQCWERNRQEGRIVAVPAVDYFEWPVDADHYPDSKGLLSSDATGFSFYHDRSVTQFKNCDELAQHFGYRKKLLEPLVEPSSEEPKLKGPDDAAKQISSGISYRHLAMGGVAAAACVGAVYLGVKCFRAQRLTEQSAC